MSQYIFTMDKVGKQLSRVVLPIEVSDSAETVMSFIRGTSRCGG